MKAQRPLIIAGGVAVLLGMTACVPGTSGTTTPAATAGAEQALTADDVAALGDVTLKMDDFGTLPALDTNINQIITDFEAEFPNVDIERSSQAFASYADTLKLTLSGNDAPDVFQLATTRELIKGQLVRPLDGYYDAYGWGADLPATIDELMRISTDSTTVGEGPHWGGVLGGNIVVVFYNKSLLSQIGASVPATFDEFESSLDAAKTAGIVPVQVGNAESFPAQHVTYSVEAALGDQEESTDWFMGDDGSTFVSDANLDAATTVQDWAKAGYFPEGVNGLAVAASRESFLAGQGLYYIGTSYLMGAFNTGLGEDLGAFVMPSESGDDTLAVGNVGDQFAISAASENADLAAYLMDYMNDPKYAAGFVSAGYLPYATDSYTPPADAPGMQDVVSAFQAQVAADSFIPFPDNATPTMGTVMGPMTQELIGLTTDPDAYVDAIQQDWLSFYGE